jgi:hypothetical protein
MKDSSQASSINRKKADNWGTSMFRCLLSGYDRSSLVPFALLVIVYITVGALWNDLLRQNLGVINWYLVAIWVTMNALLCWDVRPTQDIALALVGLVGGLGFEWWGTNTQLWSYFTAQKPPVWILPAWPVAALATARVAFALERVLSLRKANWQILYWVSMATFTGGMVHFLSPSIGMLSSRLVVGLIAGVIASSKAPRRDFSLFVAGSFLGIFLEYWGTSRNCWTYYTLETPPLITVAAHGFAQVVYARTLSGLEWSLRRAGLAWKIRAREYPPSIE